jgi:hypothetical protein
LVQAHGRAPRRQPPRRPAGGPVSTCCVPGSPTRPAPWPWTSPVSARRPGGAAAGTPAKRRPWATVDLVAAGHGQPPHHRFPSGPMQAGDHLPADTGGTSTHCAQSGGPHTQPLQVQRDADRTAALRGQRWPVRPDTWTLDAWTPDAWTLDVRSTGWTDIPGGTGGADRATTSLAGVRTSSRRRPPAGRPDLTRVTAPGGARPPRTAPR